MGFAHVNRNRDHQYERVCANALIYPDGKRPIMRGDGVFYTFGKTIFAATVIQSGKCRVLIEHIDLIGDKRVRRVRWCVPASLVYRSECDR